uniref:Polypyrimidine tract binding protein 3 n=2 Tax=Sinocyclocheilus grahami TaxID=75366 RepID=A0A672L8S7_SINGR
MPVLAFGKLVKLKNANLSLSFSFLAANGTDDKTYKGERSPCDPSRVLHIRRVPIEVSEAEVISLGVPFGKVTNLLMLKGKNQVGAPLTCKHISALSFSSVSILQHDYWNLRHLRNTDGAQAALQAVSAMHSGNMTLSGTATASDGGMMPGQSPVLRLIVENLYYPVSLEVLHQVKLHYTEMLWLSVCACAGAPGIISSPYPGAAGFAPAIGFHQAGLSMQTMPGALGHLTIPSSAMTGRMTIHGMAPTIIHSVLLVSNLNPDSITPHGLFILFGVYGDVHRVKILFNKKENALIQMADATQAQLAMSHLNGQRLYGKVIRVTISKHQTVQLPREGQEDQGLTKDFSGSPLHRFKKPGSKNFQNIFPPSATLHLSNIPPSTTDDFLKDLFASSGYTVKAFKFFQKDRKMALIQLGSVEEAIQALIDLHNHDLGENHHLRVSFSKSTI